MFSLPLSSLFYIKGKIVVVKEGLREGEARGRKEKDGDERRKCEDVQIPRDLLMCACSPNDEHHG